MSLLTAASANSVSRGYDYYKSNKVTKIKEVSNEEYDAYVKGSDKTPYYVKINIKYPKKSYCDCPHANGNIICKHMVALYFSLFEDELEDYESWLENDYYEDEYEEDYNYYDRDYYRKEKFNKPLFFDEILESFVNSLNSKKLKEILLEELLQNEKRTYEIYIKDYYKKYIDYNNDNFKFLEKLNSRVHNLIEFVNYNNCWFNDEILNKKEKKIIEKIYINNTFNKQVDKILFIPELAMYKDYFWIADFYKNNKSKKEIELFISQLENYFNSLKHYSIKNNIPKSNILITIYILKDYSLEELAKVLLKNSKYNDYIEFVINNYSNYIELYNEIIKEVKKNYLTYKSSLSKLLHEFVIIDDFNNKEIEYNYFLYSYLCESIDNYLNIMVDIGFSEDKIISDIESNTKNVFMLIKLYRTFNRVDKLWDLLNNQMNKEYLLNNIDILKEKYNDKLYEYFLNEFYLILEIGKKREVYQKASKYVKGIIKLNNGDKYIDQLLYELNNSEYKKCKALLDEIDKVINQPK